MKIYFYGSTETVTGSNILLEDNNSKILIDCGLVQKERTCDIENFYPFPYDVQSIKAVLLTHAHLDHSGRLPKLIKEGFKGYVYSTPPTKDLAKEILLDSQKIINQNCQELNKQRIYSEEEIDKLLERWQTINYHQPLTIDNFNIEFFNSGHILGSAFIKINNLVISGDLGNKDKSLTQELEPLPNVNYLVLESTYGNRLHKNLDTRINDLEKIIEKVIYEKRILLIPTFALERAQEIIFDIQKLIETKKIPDIKIYLDSPLAKKISRIYEKYPEYLNHNASVEILTEGLFNNDYLKIIENDQDELEMIKKQPPKIILAGSGMIMGGKIVKILDQYLNNEKLSILFIGYQAPESLGRKILDGEMKIKGEILTLFSYSAHRDQAGILEWVKPQRFNLKEIFLVHGNNDEKKALQTLIMDSLALKTTIPHNKENVFEIL
ncbi:MAG: MBL fold hydrolase [Candidatus Parcubacteria bacterium]|nr:MAG: MBL fold hydrolase [Candidatus Parcubacteria bacterium]